MGSSIQESSTFDDSVTGADQRECLNIPEDTAALTATPEKQTPCKVGRQGSQFTALCVCVCARFTEETGNADSFSRVCE